MQKRLRKKWIYISVGLVLLLLGLVGLSWKLNFSPEVDAAIISSLFSTLLFCGTIVVNTVLTSEALKLGPKTQLLMQERLALYKELSTIMHDLNQALLAYFFLKKQEYRSQIIESHFRLRTFRRKSMWILPEDILATLSKIQSLFSVSQTGGILFNPKCLETREVAIQFSNLYQSLVNQMRDELDIQTISDVINHKVYKMNQPVEGIDSATVAVGGKGMVRK
ncbi:hypothetical protein [Laceyella sacchari]|jgi:hypothetical protein|uniref:Uncharacterized protein n=1 Tax=Laceyella sacchari TaxID=37482 RepID=A0ABY5U4H9_LACSH|nr:hypothetical protein [Laceyella sacchari]TCW38845.1 hypothetical protein EDC32_10284 [Laceyella sacchari]UWE03182.1 hypothetical protein NYR52_13845 [Laceyella sacchari]